MKPRERGKIVAKPEERNLPRKAFAAKGNAMKSKNATKILGALLLAALLIGCLAGSASAAVFVVEMEDGAGKRTLPTPQTKESDPPQENAAPAPEEPAPQPQNDGGEKESDTAKTAAGMITHTVVKGDTLWKLAVRYEIGLSEIIAANPQIKDPHWIYPGDVVFIPQNDRSVTDFEAEVIRLVNEIRVKNGLSELKANWQLSRVARYKSQDMHDKRYFSHESPTYGTPFQMMKDFGISYRTAGENIAMGYRTPRAVVDGWMNSPGHRANILNGAFTEIGVGFVQDGDYWTQMFIG